jgi:NAD(P)-dependent dehydrogenase (short-subunit alcohol dehydrogenase family)
MPSALITGANRGLGLEFARQYLADGWQVYAACRDPVPASELRRLAEDSGETLRILAMDVTDPVSIKAAAKEFDGQTVDLLLNNAGIIGPRGQTIGNIDYEAWAKVLDVNTMGPMRVSEAFVDHVAQSDRKLIVTLTSGMGSLANNTSGGSNRLSQLEGRGEHGDAQSSNRSRSTRHYLRGRQSRLGPD